MRRRYGVETVRLMTWRVALLVYFSVTVYVRSDSILSYTSCAVWQGRFQEGSEHME